MHTGDRVQVSYFGREAVGTVVEVSDRDISIKLDKALLIEGEARPGVRVRALVETVDTSHSELKRRQDTIQLSPEVRARILDEGLEAVIGAGLVPPGTTLE